MSSPEILLLPGAVDLHVHLRQPSVNGAETISSGTRAALLGGYVMLGDMPNNPGHETWTEERILEKRDIVETDAYVPVGLYAGSQPSSDNIGELAKIAPHSIGLKLYGAPTTGNDRDYSASDFLPILAEWHRVAPDKPIMLHAGKENLEEMIGVVAGELGHALHVCHVNDPEDVELICEAKDTDLDVSCGVCPHHLFKTSHDVSTQGWFARMQPPLAEQTDAEALFRQLVEGKIDVVETDHAPHLYESKIASEEQNPWGIHNSEHTTCFGVPGIEFALPLLLYQAKRGRITVERIAEVTSKKPAEIFGVHVNSGTQVAWEMREYRIEDESEQVHSGSGWTPFLGMLAVGEVRNVQIGSKFVLQEGSILGKAGRTISQRGDRV